MSSINSYLFFISPIAPLSRDEEKELLIKAQAGNQAARTKLIKANILYVATVAKKYSLSIYDIEDIMAWGCMGLNKAISKFNVNSGYKLITYANRCINTYIRDNIKTKSVKCNTSLDNYLSSDSEDTILEKIGADNSQNPEEELLLSELHKDLESFLSTLPERDATIIKARAGYGYDNSLSLSKIGEIVGLTKGGVHEVEKRINKIARSSKNTVDLTDYLAS